MAQECEYCGGESLAGRFCCQACQLDYNDGLADTSWRDNVDPGEYLDDLAEYNAAEADDYRNEDAVCDYDDYGDSPW